MLFSALGDSGPPPSTPASVLRKEGPGLTATEPGAAELVQRGRWSAQARESLRRAAERGLLFFFFVRFGNFLVLKKRTETS